MDWMIYSVPRNPLATWCCIGSSRGEVEARYQEGIINGRFDQPVYRVVARKKNAVTDPAVAHDRRPAC